MYVCVCSPVISKVENNNVHKIGEKKKWVPLDIDTDTVCRCRCTSTFSYL